MLRNARTDADAHYWKVVDLHTGEEIMDVVWADDKKGIYGKARRDANGNIVANLLKGEIFIDTVHREIKFIKSK